MLKKILIQILGLGDLVKEVEELRENLDAFKENIEEYDLDSIENIDECLKRDEFDDEVDTYIENSSNFENRVESIVADYLKHRVKPKSKKSK